MELLMLGSPTLLSTFWIPHKGIRDSQRFIPHGPPTVAVSSSSSAAAIPDSPQLTTLAVAAAALCSGATLDSQMFTLLLAVLTHAIPDVPEENITLRAVRQLLTRRIPPGRRIGRLTKPILLPTVTA
jgi:hypothetical protein